MSYTREILSASTNGRGIKVAATASAGTTIHTAQTGTSLKDTITLYAYNSDTQDRVLTIEFGGTTAPDDNIVQTIPSKAGLVPVLIDLPLRNTLIVKAFCDTTNVVIIFGYYNKEA